MPDTSPDPEPADVTEPAQELQLVEQGLADLRQEADDLRAQIGDPDTVPGELEDRANLLVSLETHEHLIDRFEARAEELRHQLGRA